MLTGTEVDAVTGGRSSPSARTPQLKISRRSSKAVDVASTPPVQDAPAGLADSEPPEAQPGDDPFLQADLIAAESTSALQKKLSQLSTESSYEGQADENDPHEAEFREQQQRKRDMLIKELLDKSRFPSSYYTNTPKEEQILEFVDNFNRQYTQLYPGRKELLLSPPNHFGTKKFVCTSIRQSQLPYRELYDYRGCAKFLSEFLSYVPLEPPHELPQTIPGPAYTARLQQGNAFDYSILLVSLLRGVGYDAYVVSGYASRSVTLMDQSRITSDAVGIASPMTARGEQGSEKLQRVGKGADATPNKYRIKPPRQLKSQFLSKQEEKLKVKEREDLEARQKREAEAQAMSDDDDDELKGLRVHSWVLVLPGKREVAEAFFIEPTTGAICSPENECYLGVESVFSSVNYWVNMQVCYEGLKGISFDLGDNTKWEFVLLDNTQPGGVDPNRSEEDDVGDNASDEEDNEDNTPDVLDLPPSWVERLHIPKEDFEARCPLGAKSVVYQNARHELFADYCRKDGMVSRVTFFADDATDFNGEIHEYFANRRDKLRQRIRVPFERRVHEFFDPGRPHGLKEHVIVEGYTKEVIFYPSARSDGLVKRVDDITKVMEYFTERDDRLVYRSVTFEDDAEDDDPVRGAIIKMTEKFDRDPDVSVSQDAAKRTYFLREDKIRVTYHLPAGRIIAATREFRKPTAEQKNTFLDMIVSFDVNPYVKPYKRQQLYAELLELLRAEQTCLSAIKNSDREIADILSNRHAEEKDVALSISIYDTIRNQTDIPSEEQKETYKEEEEAKAADLDYLSPFLVNHDNPMSLGREEALQVKDACLKSFKERLIEKANIIQGRLDEVTAEYQRRQLAYSRNADSMTVEETEEYVKFCNDALFKIHILEKRLAKHKETAPERYIELDSKLKADTRLRAAFKL
ncbi:hypothetical protein BC832DRAFT_4135 [Gaertneriomyces semiglobifer]|nr:hypothetical protein BC832DRAFT_4135 [Gaertneriomyces semiglobifer]